MPLGGRPPVGLIVKVDGGEDVSRVAHQFCNRNACRAAFLFNEKRLSRSKAGNKASISMMMRAGREIAVPVSLNGFAKGVRAVEAG